MRTSSLEFVGRSAVLAGVSRLFLCDVRELGTLVDVSSERDHWESVWTEKSFDEVSWHQTDVSA